MRGGTPLRCWVSTERAGRTSWKPARTDVAVRRRLKGGAVMVVDEQDVLGDDARDEQGSAGGGGVGADA